MYYAPTNARLLRATSPKVRRSKKIIAVPKRRHSYTLVKTADARKLYRSKASTSFRQPYKRTGYYKKSFASTSKFSSAKKSWAPKATGHNRVKSQFATDFVNVDNMWKYEKVKLTVERECTVL